MRKSIFFRENNFQEVRISQFHEKSPKCKKSNLFVKWMTDIYFAQDLMNYTSAFPFILGVNFTKKFWKSIERFFFSWTAYKEILEKLTFFVEKHFASGWNLGFGKDDGAEPHSNEDFFGVTSPIFHMVLTNTNF